MPRAYPLVLAAAALCYAALGAVLRILPGHVGDDLHGSAAAVGLAVGAPALSAVVARPGGGRLADRLGPRPLILAGAAVMAAGVLPSFAHGLGALDASRLLVGAGEGAMMAATVLWLLRIAGPARRGRALGHIGLANYAGLAAGPLLADALGGDADRVFVAALILPLVAGAVVAVLPAAPPAPATVDGPQDGRGLVRATLRPGIGLALVNVGYVAVLAFGAAVGREHDAAAAGLVVPVFAVTVIAARLLGAGIPDRAGARRTLLVCALAEGLGLVAVSQVRGSAPILAAVVVLAAGQALAVPSLGLLALARVAPERHGAAAGLFFSWFDAGVGLGGPLVGTAARATSPATAIALAGAAVASVGALSRTRPSGSRAPARGRRDARRPPGPARPARCPGRSP
jgi:predicted MFS family arabinose efflux permease